MDLTLRDSDGLELIKDIRARWPKTDVLVVSMHDESLYAERVIRAGAKGYITKQEATRNVGRNPNQNRDFSPGEGVNEKQQEKSKPQQQAHKHDQSCGCG